MELRYFMLQNGFEMIGEIESEPVDGERYDLRRLKNPWRLLLTQHGYVPAPCPASWIDLDRSNILLEGGVDDDLANVYREKQGGIVTPAKGVVLPH